MSESRKLFLSTSVVERAVKKLRSSKIHPTFAGYLCAKREERKVGSSRDLRPPFREFFDEYLRPSNGTEGRPYLRPFSSNGDLSSEPWINPNVAGSYAPSSLREKSPIRRIFLISPGAASSQPLWSFLDGSADVAKAELLHGHRIEAWALASYLYRDFRFEIDDGEPTLSDVIEIFRDDFAFRSSIPNEAAQFTILFDEVTIVDEIGDAFMTAPN